MEINQPENHGFNSSSTSIIEPFSTDSNGDDENSSFNSIADSFSSFSSSLNQFQNNFDEDDWGFLNPVEEVVPLENSNYVNNEFNLLDYQSNYPTTTNDFPIQTTASTTPTPSNAPIMRTRRSRTARNQELHANVQPIQTDSYNPTYDSQNEHSYSMHNDEIEHTLLQLQELQHFDTQAFEIPSKSSSPLDNIISPTPIDDEEPFQEDFSEKQSPTQNSKLKSIIKTVIFTIIIVFALIYIIITSVLIINSFMQYTYTASLIVYPPTLI